MKLEELAVRCADAIEAERGVVLVIPGPAPRGEKIRLIRGTRRRCPMGEILSWTQGGTVALFDPIDVLAYLAANAAVKVITTTPGSSNG